MNESTVDELEAVLERDALLSSNIQEIDELLFKETYCVAIA